MRLHVLDLVLDQVRHGGVPLPEELLDLLVELELLGAGGLVRLEEVSCLARVRVRVRVRMRVRMRVRLTREGEEVEGARIAYQDTSVDRDI